MAEYTCPFCGSLLPPCKDVFAQHFVTFKENDYMHINITTPSDPTRQPYPKETIQVCFYKCPSCKEISITLQGIGESVKDTFACIYPNSPAKHFPDYIPTSIRNDYKEAYAIVKLSPKASATLSRRCLQAMIRDFWGINKKTLYAEIEALEDSIPSNQKEVLHSLRNIGNIGAHPEADVNTIIDIEPEDSIKLIKVIEFFMDKWYIDRYEREKLFREINDINDEMQSNRNR